MSAREIKRLERFEPPTDAHEGTEWCRAEDVTRLEADLAAALALLRKIRKSLRSHQDEKAWHHCPAIDALLARITREAEGQ